MTTDASLASGIRDNYLRGRVGDYLRARLEPGAEVAIVSAYFTIYAYAALQDQLDTIERLRFLFGEPRFVQAIDPARNNRQGYQLVDNGLQLTQRLQQGAVARACAEWIRQKVEIRSIRQANLLHGKMYHIQTGGSNQAILGSSNFTVNGLGSAGNNNNIELNLVVDSQRDRQDLLAWFDALWYDETRVTDVRDEVLTYLAQLHRDNAPA